MHILARNQRANYDYQIKSSYQAGMVLSGAETKSLKGGNVSLAGSRVEIGPRGAFLIGCHIGPYRFAARAGYDPLRPRQLLLRAEELKQLLGKERGLLVVPLEIVQNPRGLVKIKIGLGRPRKKTDKRDYLKKREDQKSIRNLE